MKKEVVNLITITPEALEYIKQNGKPLYIDVPPLISCCVDLVDHPAVRTGIPHDKENYVEKTIQGIKILVPVDLPDIPLSIEISKFLGFKRLCLEGWKLC